MRIGDAAVYAHIVIGLPQATQRQAITVGIPHALTGDAVAVVTVFIVIGAVYPQTKGVGNRTAEGS